MRKKGLRSGFIGESGISPAMVVVMVVVLYILLGMIMDQAAIIILTAPITAPLMVAWATIPSGGEW